MTWSFFKGQFAKDSPLPWRTRLNILVDAAQGDEKLHGLGKIFQYLGVFVNVTCGSL